MATATPRGVVVDRYAGRHGTARAPVSSRRRRQPAQHATVGSRSAYITLSQASSTIGSFTKRSFDVDDHREKAAGNM